MTARSMLRLGTRGSLLAIAQSRLVMRALLAADPGVDIELVTFSTPGDRNRSVPLSAVREPDFFSADIDAALRDGRIDLAVHSLKDLPLGDRPGIRTAAVPRREDPRDVVVFRPGIDALLRNGECLRIGSSSQRRSHLTHAFLRDALPRLHDAGPRLAHVSVRGPVEQRLRRIRLQRSDPHALDGVVLALAGLARLWGDRDGHSCIAPLLADTRLMVLPLGACPTAPGQGALAVDCRADDEALATRLAVIDDAPSARRVRRELGLLAALPADARGGFAATSVHHERCGTLLFVQSCHGAEARSRLIWKGPPPPRSARAWDGAEWIRASQYRPAERLDLGKAPAMFLAHWRALPPHARLPEGARCWVSGLASWRELARRGQWVEGCADNLGFRAITTTLAAPVLRLPPLSAWTVLTREDAVGSWAGTGVGAVRATYAIDEPHDAAALQEIRSGLASATHFFWGSAAQYRALRRWLPAGSHHACGPGKTFEALREDGVANLQAFPSRREWQSWVA
jgi:hydroxymethylbilane synthase